MIELNHFERRVGHGETAFYGDVGSRSFTSVAALDRNLFGYVANARPNRIWVWRPYVGRSATSSDLGDHLLLGDVLAGEVLHIPSHVQHKAEALEDTLDVDIFSPPRQDWLDKTDDYLRQK